MHRRKVVMATTVVVASIVASLVGYHIYSQTRTYEVKVLLNESATLWIGFQEYRFELFWYNPSDVTPPLQPELIVSCGSDSETISLHRTYSIAQTYRVLDLEIYVKGQLVGIAQLFEGFRLEVRKS